jgi:hypothetical protein
MSNHEPVRKLNPNHPVTQFMDTEWVKIVGLLMYRDGITKTVIPDYVVTKFAGEKNGHNVAIRFIDGIGIELFLIDDKEAARLAHKAGGLPI